MSCVDTIKRMRVEPFIFLYMFAFSLEGLTIAQLAQDKICVARYALTGDYCAQLGEMVTSDSKNRILADVTTFTLYKTLINTIPVIFWSLFLGAWADKHSNAPKFLMSIASIASCIESILLYLNAFYFQLDVNLLLLAFVPFSLSGGLLSIMMSLYSYVSGTTEPQFRTIKFAIIEALIFVSAPLGIFIGGSLIGNIIKGPNGQLHDYSSVFIVGFIAQVLATVWIIWIPFEKRIYSKTHKTFDKIQEICITEEVVNNNDEREPLLKKSVTFCDEIKTVEQVLDISLCEQESRCASSATLSQNSLTESAAPIAVDEVHSVIPAPDVHWYEMFKDLFDMQNVRDMWSTCTKHRADGKRKQIWILMISLTLITLTNNGSIGVLFQFVQRVFQWNPKTFSVVNASTLLMTSISVVIIVPVLIKVFKFSDMSLSIVGTVSINVQYLIRGTFLNEIAFYLSYMVGSLAYVPMISVRSMLSSIVDPNEVNKVFGLLSTLETITPFLSSLLYSALFNATITQFPGLVFQFSSAILMIPLIGFVYIALKCV